MKYILVGALGLLVAGCDYDACTKESADVSGAYFSRCLQGDGYKREGHRDCAFKALEQDFCKPVARPK